MTPSGRIIVVLVILILFIPILAITEQGSALSGQSNDSNQIQTRGSGQNDTTKWSYYIAPGQHESGGLDIESEDPNVHILTTYGYLRSESNGKSWDKINNDIHGNDLFLNKQNITNEADNVFVVGSKEKENGNYKSSSIYFRKSSDNGKTWKPEYQLSMDNNQSSFNPCVVADNKYVHVIWTETVDGKHNIYYRRSNNYGNGWMGVKLIKENLELYSNTIKIFVINGKIHLFWTRVKYGWTDELSCYYIFSEDNGTTWSSEIEINENRNLHTNPEICFEDENIYVFWREMLTNESSSNHLFYKKSNDNGVTWSSIKKIENLFNKDYSYPAVAIENNEIHIIYERDYKDTSEEMLYYINSKDSGTTWSQPEVIGEYYLKLNEYRTYIYTYAIAIENGKIHVAISINGKLLYVNNLKNSLADLTCVMDEIYFSDPNPSIRDEIEIIVPVYNFGDTTAHNISLEISVSQFGLENKTIHIDQITELKSSEKFNISFYWAPAIPGDFNMLISIDEEDFVHEHNELNNKFELYFSVYGNWTGLKQLSGPDSINSTNPNIIVNTNYIHIVWIDHHEGYGIIKYIKSENYGEDWTQPVEIGEVSPRYYYPYSVYTEYYPLEFIGDQNFLYLVWQNYRDGNSTNYESYFSMSSDNGNFWSDPIMISDNDIYNSTNPSISKDSNKVYVAWIDDNGFEDSIYIKVSEDNGSTWSEDKLTNSDASYNYHSIYGLKILAENDIICLVTNEVNYGDDSFMNVYFSAFCKSSDQGESWSQRVWLQWGDYTFGGLVSDIHEIEVNGNEIIVLFKGEIFNSSDNGISWEEEYIWGSADLRVLGDDIYLAEDEYHDHYYTSDLFIMVKYNGDSSWVSYQLTKNNSESKNPQIWVNKDSLHYVWEDNRNGNWEIFYRSIDLEDLTSSNLLPTVEITSPLMNSIVSDIVFIHGLADDDNIVQNVQVQINNSDWKLTNGTTNWYYEWDTSSYPDGVYNIKARAFDGEFYSKIDNVTVIVKNGKIITTNDTDLDGVPDIIDPDDDNDGYNDTIEDLIGTNKTDVNSTPLDEDDDKIPDELDPDIDNDGVDNDDDEYPYDKTKWEDEQEENLEIYIIMILIVTLIMLIILIVYKKKLFRPGERK